MLDELQGLAPLAWDRVGCTAYFWHHSRQAYDLSNKWESLADLLVKQGFLKDDNWKVLAPIHLISVEVSKASPCVLLKFWDSSDDDLSISNPLDHFANAG